MPGNSLGSSREGIFHPNFVVGRQIRILDIFPICLRFEYEARLELGRNLPTLDDPNARKKIKRKTTHIA
jgi:hypothetical protein